MPDTQQRTGWSIRRKLMAVSIVSMVIFVVSLLLFYLTIGIQSAARAYVGGESLWSKSQKEAVYSLRKFAASRSQDDYDAFVSYLDVEAGDKQARLELQKPHPDLAVARDGFLRGRNHPDDINGMMYLFIYFQKVSYFARPISTWTKGDELTAQLIDQGRQIHQLQDTNASQSVISAHLAQVDELDSRLTLAEDQFSYQMGEAARWIGQTLLLVDFVVLIGVTGISLYFIYGINRRTLGDLDRLRLAVARVVKGDFSQPIEVIGEDEVAELATAFNTMMKSASQSQARLELGLERSQSDQKQLEDTKRAVLNILEDLSQEKAAAEEARLKDEALLRSIGEGLIVTDEYGNVTYLNNLAAEILGYTVQEMQGQWLPKLIKNTDAQGKELDPLERPINHALATGQPVSGQSYYQRKDGKTIPVFLTVSPVLVSGRPTGAIQVFRDFTREAELDRAKDEFVSLASHQLRTPATGVKAFASMLMDGYAGKLTGKQEEFARKIYDSNERQLRIVDDMLNAARVDSGRMVLTPSPTDMTQLLKDVISEQQATMDSRHQTIKLNAPKTKVVAEVDQDRFRMVMDNLVNNASKYTPEGGKIELGLKLDKNSLIIEVKDSGVGVAKRDISKLFTKFTRLDNVLSAKVGGSGLGLYLVANIVKLHKGKVEVESQLNKGSVFRVILPLLSKSQKQDDIVEKEGTTT